MLFTNRMSPPPIDKIISNAFKGKTNSNREVLIIEKEEIIDKYDVSIKIKVIIVPLEKM